MPHQTERFLIPGFDYDAEPIKLGVALLIEFAKAKPGEIGQIGIFIPSLAQLSGTSLEQAIGSTMAKALSKGPVRASGIELHVVTSKTIKNGPRLDGVVAIYADQKMLDLLDGFGWLKVIVAVPHSPNALGEWEKTWSPIVHGKPQAPEEPIINNKVVKQALVSLTRLVNLSNRVLNPRDEDTTKDIFRILRRHDEYEPVANIRAWAVRNGWHPKGADELCHHAERILGLKTKPKLASSTWAPDIYEKWVENARS